MAGRRELGFPRTTTCSLREQAARTTLRSVRLQGHTYVELREDGKRFIFFCTLCLAPCYSDSALFDHLKGNLHSERYAAAKVTLLGSNPWPFNDGVLFFHNSCGQDKHLTISSSNQYDFLLSNNSNNRNSNDNLAIVNTSNVEVNDRVYHNKNAEDKNLNADCGNHNLAIPGVVLNDEISVLEARFMGFGEISSRICGNDGFSNRISRLWCAWLGNEDSDDGDLLMVPKYDFAVVTFSYTYSLGRKGILDDLSPLLCSSPCADVANIEGTKKKRKKSFSDPEDVSESLSEQCVSSGDDSLVSNGPKLRLLDRYDDQLQHAIFISSKSARRELRRQQRVAAERMCDVCQHKMLPGKDVATLLNMKTGRLACSSRNGNGAFHVFHTSCLIHWILLCEFEIWTNHLSNLKVTNGTGKKSGVKCCKMRKDDERKATKAQISSVFCPECQGSGIDIEGDQIQKPTVPLSEMFNYKIKLSDARKAWMKNPEILQNCSTGLHLPCQSEEMAQLPPKLLHFYRADE